MSVMFVRSFVCLCFPSVNLNVVMDGGTDQEVRNIYNSTQWSRAGGATAAEFVLLSDKGHQRDNQ